MDGHELIQTPDELEAALVAEAPAPAKKAHAITPPKAKSADPKAVPQAAPKVFIQPKAAPASETAMPPPKASPVDASAVDAPEPTPQRLTRPVPPAPPLPEAGGGYASGLAPPPPPKKAAAEQRSLWMGSTQRTGEKPTHDSAQQRERPAPPPPPKVPTTRAGISPAFLPPNLAVPGMIIRDKDSPPPPPEGVQLVDPEKPLPVPPQSIAASTVGARSTASCAGTEAPITLDLDSPLLQLLYVVAETCRRPRSAAHMLFEQLARHNVLNVEDMRNCTKQKWAETELPWGAYWEIEKCLNKRPAFK